MSWAVGYDDNWKRDVGYGVPATCDHPRCDNEIHRGLAHVCGSDIYGGDYGCGLFFCADHMQIREPRGAGHCVNNCRRCATYKLPYAPKPDTSEWINHKLTDPSWQGWRDRNADWVESQRAGD